MFTRSLQLLAMAALVGPALADEESPWSGEATLGYLATSGNTENSNINAGFEVNYTSGNWVHGFQASAIGASESNVSTAEAYGAGWRSERELRAKSYVFGVLDWRSDRFSTYEKQFSQSVGYGRRLIASDKHNLNLELGAGARQSDLADGSSETEAIVRGGLYYVWALSETAEFKQDLKVEAGDINTYVESVTALSAKLVGNLALVASYTVRHNTDVLPLTEKTDTFTALSFEYRF